MNEVHDLQLSLTEQRSKHLEVYNKNNEKIKDISATNMELKRKLDVQRTQLKQLQHTHQG